MCFDSLFNCLKTDTRVSSFLLKEKENFMKIITDSASDIQLDVLKEKNIDLIPMTIQVGLESILDDKTKNMNEFWNIMEAQSLSTSQPSPIYFMDLFEKIKKEKEEAIFISVSSALSGTYSQAVMAKEMIDYEKIYIIDSKNVTAGQAQLVYYACQLRDDGYSTLDIVDILESFKKKIHIYACLDTLEYLARLGRINTTVSSIGDFVKVKPILTVMDDGTLGIYKMKRGVKKAIKELEDIYNSSDVDLRFPMIPLYSKDKENCDELVKSFNSNTDYFEIGCTVGCHAGPNAFGIVFIEK